MVLMAASDHLSGAQFRQLEMFTPARELMDPAKYTPGDFSVEGRASGWARKLAEAKEPMAVSASPRKKPKGPSLRDNIRENGIYWPVDVSHRSKTGNPSIDEGHHRIAAAHDIDPNYLVPVRNHGRWRSH